MEAPPSIILDTDMGNDIDDALALVMLHELQRLGECRLIGVTVCKGTPWASAYTRLINARCGQPDLPVGQIEYGPTPEHGNFVRQIAEPRGPWPQSEDAVSLLRRLLASQSDQTVVLVSIGFFTNLSRLLESGPDGASPLGGRELVARKTRFVSSMAGNFRPDISSGPDVGNPEFNIRTDIAAARHFAAHCPCPMIFSGFEIGVSILSPASAIEAILAVEPDNPVAAAYAAYLPMPYDRPMWDQTAVLQAVRPDAGYFDLSAPGNIGIDPKGYTDFTPCAGGPHHHLILCPEQIGRVRDSIIQLSTRFSAPLQKPAPSP